MDWWRHLGTPARQLIQRDGKIARVTWGERPWESLKPRLAQAAHDRLAGLSVEKARVEITDLLRANSFLESGPHKIKHSVKFYERGTRPLEHLVSRQWFIKVLERREDLLELGRNISWYPARFLRTYEHWVEGLNQDWCVSRQRYFGIPIPIWYRATAEGTADYDEPILPEPDRLPIDPAAECPPGYSEGHRNQPGGFVEDSDVLDTWATSSLTPFLATGWPGELSRHRALYPADLRPQSHEIIRTWAFYTLVRAMLLDNSLPWRSIAISGWVVDPNRRKMSKSKGNITRPDDLIADYGADAIRYWASLARLGVDTTFDPKVFQEGKRLVTKIRNAGRLVTRFDHPRTELINQPMDVALLSDLSRLVTALTEAMDSFDHAAALESLRTWFWSAFCDNYLELIKHRGYAGDSSAARTSRFAMEVLLKLFAPFLPFIAEEIWQELRPGESIHSCKWPNSDDFRLQGDSQPLQAAMEVLRQLRRAKSEAKLSVRWPVERLDVAGPPGQLEALSLVMEDVVAAGNVDHYRLLESNEDNLRARIILGINEQISEHRV